MGKKALGRSMAAIFGDHQVLDAKDDVVNESALKIALSKIVPNPYQPRTHFDDDEIQGLANSIREQGLLTPILLRKNGDEYQIIAGERRFRACKLLAWDSITAGIFDKVSDKKMMEWALIENIQRVQLSAIEEARAFEQLIENHSYTHEELASTLGKSRSAVTNTLRLLRLPTTVQEYIQSGVLTAGHARNLLRPDVKDPESLAKEIIESGMSVRATEKTTKKPKAPKKEIWVDPNVKAIEDEFRFATGSEVRVNYQGRGGQISIPFQDGEDLHRILELIKSGQEKIYGH